MTWLNNLEKKFGRYAISNISNYFIFLAFIGYIISIFDSLMMNKIGMSISGMLSFNMYAILHGQIWRLVTWVFCQPGGGSILNLIFLLCLLSMGNTLENIIGTFRMNVYMFGGLILTLIGGILVYFIGYPIYSAYDAAIVNYAPGMPYLSTYYILISIFMALAICVPDATVNLYFIFPIKMKWMLIVYFADLGYQLFLYFEGGGIVLGLGMGCQIIFALINLGLFFLFARPHMTRKHKKRRREFQSQFREPRPGSGITKHKCAICGRTELDDPNLQFRYCSKCAGNYEYCQEHLFTHEHIRHM